jgi:hypothetical protein
MRQSSLLGYVLGAVALYEVVAFTVNRRRLAQATAGSTPQFMPFDFLSVVFPVPALNITPPAAPTVPYGAAPFVASNYPGIAPAAGLPDPNNLLNLGRLRA